MGNDTIEDEVFTDDISLDEWLSEWEIRDIWWLDWDF